MQVRVFEAPDMATGLRKIRQELGPDALILSTRTIKNGKLGLLGKQHLEITAAIDNQFSPVSSTASDKIQAQHKSRAHAAYSNSSNEDKNLKDHNSISIAESLNKADLDKHLFPTEISSPTQKEESPQMRKEIDELKNLVTSLAGEITRMHNQTETAANDNTVLSALEKKLLSSRNNPALEDHLLNHGINQETAKIIATFASEQLSPEELCDPETTDVFLRETISDLLQISKPEFDDDTGQKRISLIGPTGVGKTTTLAKIAANYLSSKSNSIAMITIDTYRIAAVEQLKVYGEIMHLPVEVVLSPQQLIDALEKHSDKELILIDTAGRSQLDSLSIQELSQYLLPELHISNYLVLSAATRDNELLEAIKNFSQLSIHSTIYTKVDECVHHGTILNTQIKSKFPISYITNGQRVPEDIVEVDSPYLAQLILPNSNGIEHDE